jgi:hypothetical protein
MSAFFPRRRIGLGLYVCVGLLALAGCSKAPEEKAQAPAVTKPSGTKAVRPKEKARPVASLSNPRVGPKQKNAFSIFGLLGERMIAHAGDMTVDLLLFSPYPGTTVQIGQQKATIDEKQRAVIKLDLKPLLLEKLKQASATSTGFFGPAQAAVPVKITTAEGESRSGDLSIATAYLFEQWFEDTARKGQPMVLAGEPESTNQRRALLYKEGNFLRRVGQPGGWESMDLVGFTEYKGDKKVRCGTYKGQKTGKVTIISMNLYGKEARVHDRRTGKLLAKKQFQAKGRCPKQTSSTSDVSFFPEDAPIAAWYARQVKK